MYSFFRRYPEALHWIFASAPLLLVLVICFFSFGSENELISFCRAHSAAHPDLKNFAGLVTDWGNALFYPVYLYFLISGIRQKKKSRIKFALVYLIVQLAVSLLLVRITKIAIGKPRPYEGGLFEPMTHKGAYHSMPSGHTSEIYGASMPLVFRYRAFLLTAALGIFAALVALSRIYLTRHYPSDVFCGWIMGSFAGFSIHLLTKED
jgi:undecaprenyl-diphosphatase